jgi:pimeloyl-ACP methyl ester carboxylesterase
MAVTHAVRHLAERYPAGWVLFVSHSTPHRLVVFVHGFKGRAVTTWLRFPAGAEDRAWWRESDMLYVGYDSTRDSIAGTATRLRRELPRFFPDVPRELVEIDGLRAREANPPYQQLYLVGHSLGGVIVRRAACDAAQEWRDDLTTDPHAARPSLLDAKLRLFSPASAGFRAAGWLGVAQASGFWRAANLCLRRSPAFTDLQPDSKFLADTRRRTEELCQQDPDRFRALRAALLWANPDDVVLSERYDSDFVDDFVDGTSHTSVCKPTSEYLAPWTFVETGRST